MIACTTQNVVIGDLKITKLLRIVYRYLSINVYMEWLAYKCICICTRRFLHLEIILTIYLLITCRLLSKYAYICATRYTFSKPRFNRKCICKLTEKPMVKINYATIDMPKNWSGTYEEHFYTGNRATWRQWLCILEKESSFIYLHAFRFI